VNALLLSPGLYFLIFGLLLFAKWKVWKRNLRIGFLLLYGLTLYFSTTPFIFDLVVGSWERKFNTFTPSKFNSASKLKIIILGSGHNYDDQLPYTSRLIPSALSRLAEGLRIANAFPNSRIYTSGYSASKRETSAVILKNAALELGLDEKRITTQNEPKNTKMEATHFVNKHYNIDDTLVLVTSAAHMPRAFKHFKNHGVIHLMAAPCGFLTFTDNSYTWQNFIPSFSYWKNYQLFLKEIVGYHFNK